MKAGDFSRVERDTIAQVEAGAHMLDVNAGIPLADEPAILARTIQLVQSLTDVPLSIDSSIVEALEAGLAVYQGKALVNSVTGEDERLERVLPLVKKYGAAVVAISNDETGISEDPDVRFAVAKRIVERAADHGIPREDIVVDPLLMPIGAMPTAGRQVFRILGRLRDELDVNSTCGATNGRFGLPHREGINGAYLAMAMASGLTSAITNPIARASARRSWPPTSCTATTATRPAGSGPPGRAAGRRGGRSPNEPATGRCGRGTRLTTPMPTSTDVEPLVIFTPSGRRGRFSTGTTVLDAARTLGVDIDSVCGGRGICGRCQVEQSVGSFPKHGIESKAGNLSPFGPVEADYREPQGARPGATTRAARPTSGATSSSTSRRRARSIARSSGRASSSVTSTSTRSSGSTTSRSRSPSWPRRRATSPGSRKRSRTSGSSRTSRRTSRVVRALQPALEKGSYAVTVAVHGGSEIIAVWPGFHDRAYGIAIDVGSTTIAGHLANLHDGAVLASHGVMNPQIRFGEDLMSRVSYAMMHPEGAAEMTAAVRTSLSGLIATLGLQGGRPARRGPRPRDRRQPDHASPRARHRPGAARLRAVRARDRPRRGGPGLGAGPDGSSRARACTCCRASRATSAPTRPA